MSHNPPKNYSSCEGGGGLTQNVARKPRPDRDPTEQSQWDAVPFGDHWHGGGIFSPAARVAGQGLCPPGVATPVPLREPAGLDTNNTLLGRKVLERGRGLAQGDQVLPDRRNAQNCLFRKEFSWCGITWRILAMQRRVQIPISSDGVCDE